MRTAPLLKFFLIGVLCLWQVGVAPAAGRRAGKGTNDFNAWLTTYSSSSVASAAPARTANDMAAVIELLEQTRATQLEAAQKANHLTLLVGGTFAAVGLIAMLLTAYFQWRAVSRLTALSPARALPVLAPGGGPMAISRAVEQSNARLLNVVERLQQRLLELEQAARVPLSEKAAPSTVRTVERPAGNGAQAPSEGTSDVATLLARGQSLLDENEPERALVCFDRILANEPRHSEALVKKGSALEKLRRPDEAIECYDRAIAADNAMTVAYLHKGGLFNRMERYTEAVACYQQALRTQEKTPV